MTSSTESPQVAVVVRGDVAAVDREYAISKLERLGRVGDDPVLFGRLELATDADPARPRRSHAKAEIDVNGHVVRAHSEAATMHEAIDAMDARMRDRLDRMLQMRADRRNKRRRETPHEWQHGDAPLSRPDFFPRAPEERVIVRRKSFACEALTPDEAVDELELLDHDFYLFVNLGTGDDNVVARSSSGYELHEPSGAEAGASPESVEPIVRSSIPPSVMTVDEARAVLDATERPFVFFLDLTDHRGRVLYRRYDGHYGLIVPAVREAS